ncbi:hypothetical protein KAR91_79295 [Candidatus Pacearchaeota archaeon]|nr:hypothetical protein [Candidatus Pacearchaeota archaeon]
MYWVIKSLLDDDEIFLCSLSFWSTDHQFAIKFYDKDSAEDCLEFLKPIIKHELILQASIGQYKEE